MTSSKILPKFPFFLSSSTVPPQQTKHGCLSCHTMMWECGQWVRVCVRRSCVLGCECVLRVSVCMYIWAHDIRVCCVIDTATKNLTQRSSCHLGLTAPQLALKRCKSFLLKADQKSARDVTVTARGSTQFCRDLNLLPDKVFCHYDLFNLHRDTVLILHLCQGRKFKVRLKKLRRTQYNFKLNQQTRQSILHFLLSNPKLKEEEGKCSREADGVLRHVCTRLWFFHASMAAKMHNGIQADFYPKPQLDKYRLVLIKLKNFYNMVTSV